MSARRLARWAAITWVSIAVLAWTGLAQAARSHTVTQSPAIGTVFDMGTTQTLTFQIANTSTGGNVGERICEVRIRIASGSLFSAATVAPAGWTLLSFSTTSLTFRANSWASAIAVGTSVAFPLAIAMRTAAADVNETLDDVRVRYTSTTTGPPFADVGGPATTGPGGWTLASLAITAFTITDTLGAPITALVAGSSFRLVMTVRNNSSVAQNGVVSNPNPPAAVKTGTVTQALTGTAGSPLNLAPAASGTIVFTFSTAATDYGTIYFTARARRGPTVTSKLATSTTLAVGRFIASITASPSCQYVGSNITVAVALTNAYPFGILNVTPSVNSVVGAPVAYVSGPSPAAPIPNVPTSPPDTLVSWTFVVTAAGATDPFFFTATATGTGNTVGSPVLTTPTSVSANVRRGLLAATLVPSVVNAASTNVELAATVTNNGCAAISSVSISPPVGWSGAADAYSLVNVAPASAIETWTASGAGPVTFTAPDVASQMPLTFSGTFAVVFAATPPAATASVFTIRVTDANGQFADIPLTVMVNPFKSGTLNDATTRAWREDFR